MTTPNMPNNEQLSEGVSNGGADAEDIVNTAYTVFDIDKAATAARDNEGVTAETVDKLQSGEFPLG